jgi:hypothetical protein
LRLSLACALVCALGCNPVAARTPKESPMTDANGPATVTRVMLKKPSSPSALVGGLKLTLVEVEERILRKEGGSVRVQAVRLRVERGGETREVDLEKTIDVMGHRLKLLDAGDGQETPQSPVEVFATIEVGPAK